MERAGRPRMLLAYADAAYASECGRYFRRLGWEVQMVANGIEARELAEQGHPDVLVYDAGLPEDAGWLTGADFQVVVIADQANDTQLPDADVVVRREDGPHAIADTILDRSHLFEAI